MMCLCRQQDGRRCALRIGTWSTEESDTRERDDDARCCPFDRNRYVCDRHLRMMYERERVEDERDDVFEREGYACVRGRENADAKGRRRYVRFSRLDRALRRASEPQRKRLRDAYQRRYAHIKEIDGAKHTYVVEIVPSEGSRQVLDARFLDRESVVVPDAANAERRHVRVWDDDGGRGDVVVDIEVTCTDEHDRWTETMAGAVTRLHIRATRALLSACDAARSRRETQAVVDELVRVGYDVSALRDMRGRTAFFVAAQNGRGDAVAYIARVVASTRDIGDALETRSADGLSALHVATRHGHVDAVRALLEHGARADVVGNLADASTPVHVAARYSHDSLVTMLARAPASSVHVLRRLDRYGRCPAVIAASFGREKMLRTILSHPLRDDGERVDEIDASHESSTHETSNNDEIEIFVCAPSPLDALAASFVGVLETRCRGDASDPQQRDLRARIYGSHNVPPPQRTATLARCAHVVVYLNALTLCQPSACVQILDVVHAYRAGRKNVVIVVEANFREGSTNAALHVALHRILNEACPPRSAARDALRSVMDKEPERVVPIFTFRRDEPKRAGETTIPTEQRVPVYAVLQSVRHWEMANRARTARDRASDDSTTSPALDQRPRRGDPPSCLPGSTSSMALCASIRGQHMSCLDMLLDAGATVDGVCTTSSRSLTPLIVAASRGHMPSVDRLLRAGANVDVALPESGWTATHFASFRGHTDVIRRFIRAGANLCVHATSGDGAVPLMLAVREGYNDVATCLLEAGAHVDAQRRDGETALFEAVRMNLHDSVVTLLGWGASVNVRDRRGWTALHVAAKHQACRPMRALLSRRDGDRRGGASSVHTRNVDGDTALHVASAWGRVRAVTILLTYSNPREAEEDHDVRTTLRKSWVDERNFEGETAAFQAAQSGHAHVVRTLRRLGDASLDVPNASGRTPLHASASRGHIDVVRALLELLPRDALDVADEKSGSRRTALHEAAENGHVDVVTALVSAGVRVDARTARGATSVWLACRHGHAEVVRELYGLGGADVDLANHRGFAPLHVAALHLHLNCLTALVTGNADVTCETANHGQTALHLASSVRTRSDTSRRTKQLDVLRYLVSTCGLDRSTRDRRRRTAFDVACRMMNDVDSLKWALDPMTTSSLTIAASKEIGREDSK